MIRKRKRKGVMNSRPTARVVRSHQAWVRNTHECMVRNSECDGKIQFCHVRNGHDAETRKRFGGGMGYKPADVLGVPMCAEHHRRQTVKGERWFNRHYEVDMLAEAKTLATMSPHLTKELKP